MSLPYLDKAGVTYLWNKIKNLVTNALKNTNRSIEFIKTTNTAAGAALTGVTEDASLYDGKTIMLYLSYAAASNATLNLTLIGGTTTGAKPVYYTGTTRMGNTYGAGSVVSLTYVQAKDAWCRADYTVSNTNNYDRRLHNNNISAASAIAANKIIVGDKNGYKNLASGVTFDISYPILWASAAIAVGTPKATAYECYPGVNLQNTVANWTGTQWSMVYLVGTLSGTTFTVDSSVFTTTVPTTADGKVYIPIGILYSTYQLFFAPTRDMYEYKDGAFRPYDSTIAATGTTDGTIKINGTDVAVHGLGARAYDSTDYFPRAGGTMTGDVDFNKTDPTIRGNVTAGAINVYAGSNNIDGATLQLFGRCDTTYAGQFYLRASTKSTWDDTDGDFADLIGKPDGTLLWKSKEVERVNSSNANYIRYENGLQICWGDATNITNNYKTVTYPVAFTSAPKMALAGYARCYYAINDVTTSNFKIRTDQTTEYSAHYIAIGKWK